MTNVNYKASNLILNKLLSGKAVTVSQLSLLTSLSYKAVRELLAEINAELVRRQLPARIESRAGTGVTLETGDRAAVRALMKEWESAGSDLRDDPAWIEHRICLLLLSQQYVRSEELCEQLYISKSTLSQQLRLVRGRFSGAGLSVEARPHYGMHAVGSELAARALMHDLLVCWTPEQRCQLCDFPMEDYVHLSEICLGSVRAYDYPIPDQLLESLLIRLMSVLVRRRGGLAREPELEMPPKPESREAAMAARIGAQIEARFGGGMPPCELPYIAQLLRGSRRSEKEAAGAALNGERDRIDQAIGRMLAVLTQKYGIDLSADLELYSSLALHIVPLIERARVGVWAVNPIMSEIMTLYPLPFDMAIDMAPVLTEDFGITLNIHEISYIAIYIHLALERQQSRKTPKRVLVVCPAGRGMSQLVAHNISEQFGDDISVIRTCGAFELDDIDYSRFDYVFTTVPLDRELPLPTVQLPFTISETDVSEVRRSLHGDREPGSALIDLTPRELFVGSLAANSRDEAIDALVAAIRRTIPLPDDFEQLVKERERLFSTELDNMVAFPHPIRDVDAPSFMAVGVLTRPIQWKSKPVRVVMLGHTARHASRRMQRFYRQFVALVSDKKWMTWLSDQPEWETYKSISEQLSKEEQ